MSQGLRDKRSTARPYSATGIPRGGRRSRGRPGDRSPLRPASSGPDSPPRTHAEQPALAAALVAVEPAAGSDQGRVRSRISTEVTKKSSPARTMPWAWSETKADATARDQPPGRAATPIGVAASPTCLGPPASCERAEGPRSASAAGRQALDDTPTREGLHGRPPPVA